MAAEEHQGPAAQAQRAARDLSAVCVRSLHLTFASRSFTSLCTRHSHSAPSRLERMDAASGVLVIFIK